MEGKERNGVKRRIWRQPRRGANDWSRRAELKTERAMFEGLQRRISRPSRFGGPKLANKSDHIADANLG